MNSEWSHTLNPEELLLRNVQCNAFTAIRHKYAATVILSDVRLCCRYVEGETRTNCNVS